MEGDEDKDVVEEDEDEEEDDSLNEPEPTGQIRTLVLPRLVLALV